MPYRLIRHDPKVKLVGSFVSDHRFALSGYLKGYEGFSEVNGGRVPSFRDLSAGETAGPDMSGQCGEGKTPPPNKSLKRPAREPRN